MKILRILVTIVALLLVTEAQAQTGYSDQTNGVVAPNMLPYAAAVATATFSATNANTGTTLTTVTGMSVSLLTGQTYVCWGHLTGTSGATGGLKVALVASGGLTATSFTSTAHDWNGTTQNTNVTVTSLGSNIVNSASIYSDVDFTAVIVVNAAGTMNLQAAQNTANGTATTVLINSFMFCYQGTT